MSKTSYSLSLLTLLTFSLGACAGLHVGATKTTWDKKMTCSPPNEFIFAADGAVTCISPTEKE